MERTDKEFRRFVAPMALMKLLEIYGTEVGQAWMIEETARTGKSPQVILSQAAADYASELLVRLKEYESAEEPHL
jgi:hypothetical protein